MNKNHNELKDKTINKDKLKDISGGRSSATDTIYIFDDLKGESIMQDELRKISGGSNSEEIKYKINADDCISCGMCFSACPLGAITEEYDNQKRQFIYKIIDKKCDNCDACASGCPVGAIRK
jgi:ferredoxin